MYYNLLTKMTFQALKVKLNIKKIQVINLKKINIHVQIYVNFILNLLAIFHQPSPMNLIVKKKSKTQHLQNNYKLSIILIKINNYTKY